MEQNPTVERWLPKSWIIREYESEERVVCRSAQKCRFATLKSNCGGSSLTRCLHNSN